MTVPGSGAAATSSGPGERRDPAVLAEARRAIRAAHPDRYLYLRAEVPVADPLAVVGPLAGPEAFHWRDREGDGITAIGRVATIEARGADRFSRIRDRGSELLAAVDVAGIGRTDTAPGPRLLGGLAFAPDAADAEPWTGLGDARFVLPELTCDTRGGRSWVSLCLAPHQGTDEAGLDRALDRFAAAVATARSGRRSSFRETARIPIEAVPVHPGGREPAAREAYEWRVRAALEAIGRGEFDKVVVARSSRLRFRRATGMDELMARLGGGPGAFRFGVLASDRLFLGATPERLVAVRDGQARTEALAGTAPRGTDVSESLERSEKDLHEHQVVVRTIVEAIEPFCATIRSDPDPQVRDAGPVHHLATGVECELAGDAHVLDLAERLHPTPAVGGSPTAPALEWLRTHEGTRRGWYASPVGWFDARGQGELAVALRSGVLRGRDLDLFAGSGVVAGSDPTAEFDETRLKLQALPEALGLA